MLIATIAARNYLAHARVLARSFLAQHPDGRVVVLVVDAPGAGLRDDEPFDVLTPADLPIDRAELHRMATIYSVTELSTALKPFLLRHLVDGGEETVTYLDPDIEVFASLADLDELARRHAIVLTPHRLAPVADDGREPSEQLLVQTGAFNLGFIAVSAAATPFLDWWSEHCRRDCMHDLPRGLFVDQRWVDLAIAYFDHHVLRDPGCNLAYWNLDERLLGSDGAAYTAGEAPLRFFHFSGFDPRTPDILTRYLRRPRVLLSEQPTLLELCQHYVTRLEEEGREDCEKLEYGFERAANGMRIDDACRRAFREELLRRERGIEPARGAVEDLGDPFDRDGADRFVALLRSPAPGSDLPRISRYLLHVHRIREDLQRAFPDLVGLAGNHFLWWVRTMGHHELGIPPELVPSADDLEPEPEDARPLQAGVRVVGYFAAELGVGEAGRSMVAVLDALGEPYSVVYERGTANRQKHGRVAGGHALSESGDDFDLNLVCVNADRLAVVLDRLGGNFTRHRRTIGLWAWEIEEFPAWMAGAQDLVDEVWTPSAHTSRAIRRAIDKPVHTFPHPVVDRPPSTRDRASLGVPEGFVFLCCFDFHSVAERKNPSGLIDAFCRAFAPNEGPQLVLKSINGPADVAGLERLRVRARRRRDIHVVDGYLDSADLRALIGSCDAYASLHRAEGFGFTLAEAMLAGKPAIATGYSGNLEFMDETNSFLVDCEMTPIPSGFDPYPAGALWADPDLDHAAALMRQVVEDPAGTAAVAARGRRGIVERHSPEARVPLLAARLAASRAVADDPVARFSPRGPRLGGHRGRRRW